MREGQTKSCVSCGRQIDAEYNICPYCGRPQNIHQQYGQSLAQPYWQPQQYEPVGALRYVLYILSFFSILIGFIMFLVWNNDPNPEKRHVAKNCLIISVVAIALVLLSVLMAFFLYVLVAW